MRRVLPLLGCLLAFFCLTACGKTAQVSDEVSDVTVSDYAEVTFQVKYCNADAVTYTVCSTRENFLFYEGHGFAYVEKYVDGSWHPLVQQPHDSTADFIWATIPTEETQETISIQYEYGGKLEKGTYRLLAPCSLSADPDAVSPDLKVYLAAEFEID